MFPNFSSNLHHFVFNPKKTFISSMEQQIKIDNSDTSTAESDHKGSAAAAVGGSARSYDCAFCKRGFTNAQALGGHMNIHRKDKAAKAKRKDRVEDPFIQSFESSNFYPQIAAACYPQFLGERHVSCQVYMPPPDHGLQTGNYEHCFFPVWRPDNLQGQVEGKSSMRSDDDEDEEEVDLELRLGRLL